MDENVPTRSCTFLSAPGLERQACLKKTRVKSELLTDPNKLLMFEQGTRGGICQAIHRYATATNKYMENYNKDNIIIPAIFTRQQSIRMGDV